MKITTDTAGVVVITSPYNLLLVEKIKTDPGRNVILKIEGPLVVIELEGENELK